MALTNLTPADDFVTVEAKLDATIDAVNQFTGGSTGGIWTKDSGTDFDGSVKGPIVSSSTSAITYSTGWSNGGAGIDTTASIDVVGRVEILFHLTISTGGTATVGTLATTYRPIVSRRFVIADYNGTDGASALMILDINTSGVITLSKQSDGTKPVDRGSLLFTINYSSLV